MMYHSSFNGLRMVITIFFSIFPIILLSEKSADERIFQDVPINFTVSFSLNFVVVIVVGVVVTAGVDVVVACVIVVVVVVDVVVVVIVVVVVVVVVVDDKEVVMGSASKSSVICTNKSLAPWYDTFSQLLSKTSTTVKISPYLKKDTTFVAESVFGLLRRFQYFPVKIISSPT